MSTNESYEKVLWDFFLGFAAIHVLHHAAQEPIYGTAMMEELRRHGYDVSPGTLYPLLHRLESQGLLQREERNVGGRVRKYYQATDAGRSALESLRPKIAELVGEVLRGEGPTHLPDPSDDVQ